MKRFVDIVFNVVLTLAVLGIVGLILTAKAGAPGVHLKMDEPKQEIVEPVQQPVIIECVVNVVKEEPKPTYSQEELDMLALVIYQEAGSDACSDETRMMVGNVVLNRIADDRFPNTLYEVLTAVSESGYGAYGRLHWTGIVWDAKASYPSEAHAVKRAYDCAERLLNGERVLPSDVIYQAEFQQGTSLYKQIDNFFFCRG